MVVTLNSSLILRELTYGCQGRRMRGRERETGINMYTPQYLKWITNKVVLYSTGHSAQCYVAAWMGGEFGGEWIHVYVWLSPFAVLLKLSRYCQLSVIYKVKRFFKDFFKRDGDLIWGKNLKNLFGNQRFLEDVCSRLQILSTSAAVFPSLQSPPPCSLQTVPHNLNQL